MVEPYHPGLGADGFDGALTDLKLRWAGRPISPIRPPAAGSGGARATARRRRVQRLPPTGSGKSALKRASFPTDSGQFGLFSGIGWGCGALEASGAKFSKSSIYADFSACESLHNGPYRKGEVEK